MHFLEKSIYNLDPIRNDKISNFFKHKYFLRYSDVILFFICIKYTLMHSAHDGIYI